MTFGKGKGLDGGDVIFLGTGFCFLGVGRGEESIMMIGSAVFCDERVERRVAGAAAAAATAALALGGMALMVVFLLRRTKQTRRWRVARD